MGELLSCPVLMRLDRPLMPSSAGTEWGTSTAALQGLLKLIPPQAEALTDDLAQCLAGGALWRWFEWLCTICPVR